LKTGTMNQGFSSKLDRMLENDPSPASRASSQQGQDKYPDAGYTRNLCFVLPDGYRIYFGYGYIVSCAYNPEANTITIAFTSHKVTIGGYNLLDLYESLMNQTARIIATSDERYHSLNKTACLVSYITIVENEQ
jgi:hypothetical protein